MKAETDQAKIASLKRREAGTLLELGQRDKALAVAASLTEGPSPSPGDFAFLADMFARSGKWRRAEESFILAHRFCLEAGKGEKAESLAAGPLFLLAEARGDHRRCIEVAPTGLLRSRALRLSGEGAHPPPAIPETSPWRELFLLEQVHSGGDPAVLSGILDSWKAGEAEWRWRILYEGAMLAHASGNSMKQWRLYFRITGRKVLDPRYLKERKLLKALI